MRGHNAHPHKKARKHNTMKKPTTPDLEPAEITISEDGETLQIKRNARTMAAAQRLSDYLHSLECLTVEQNDQLVKLILEQTQEAEQGAFLAGTKTALSAIEDTMQELEKLEHKPPIKILQ